MLFLQLDPEHILILKPKNLHRMWTQFDWNMPIMGEGDSLIAVLYSF